MVALVFIFPFFFFLMTGRDPLLVCTISLRCSALSIMFTAFFFISLGFSSLRYQVIIYPPEPPPRAWCDERQAGRQAGSLLFQKEQEKKEEERKEGRMDGWMEGRKEEGRSLLR